MIIMQGRNRNIDELEPEKREVAVKLIHTRTMGHLITANILSKLQIMKKSDYVKKLETEE